MRDAWSGCSEKHGDPHVTRHVQIPKHLSPEWEELIRRLAESESEVGYQPNEWALPDLSGDRAAEIRTCSEAAF
jgi:DnaJ-class molecular chaperone